MTWLSVLVLGQVEARAVETGADVFTASPERRAELLDKVRARDKARAEAKATGPAVTIVENGQPAAVIVADKADLEAAKLLREWVQLMSGAELPITNQPAVKGVMIYVGQAARDAGLTLDDIQSRSKEGLRVKCDGKGVYIGGQTNTAIFRAVGRFLEQEFGCRYLDYTPAGRIYPERKTLTVSRGEFSESPGFQYRTIWGSKGAFGNYEGMTGPRGAWRYWNGEGGIGIPMAHSWGFIPETEFDKHPDWFRLDKDGNRIKGPWYNLGNPEVRRQFIEWALRASENGRKGISLSPPDDHREDFSPESQKYDNPAVIEPTSGRPAMTDRFVGMANEAAEALCKLNPDILCGFYAYADYSIPPSKPELQKLSPALSVWIAPIRFTRYHPLGHPNSPSSQELKDIVDGWSRCATTLGLRTYNFNLAEVLTPFSKISTWAHDLPYLYQRHFIGVNFESIDDWEIYGPHLYLSMRLAYDPRLDPWEIMADYWDKSYGPAAEIMEKYWMEIDGAFINLKTDTGSTHALHHVYTPERLKLLDGTLAEAERLVKGQARLEYRVNLARRGLTRAFYWRNCYEAMNRGDVDGAATVFNDWFAFLKESSTMGHVNPGSDSFNYLHRFVGKNLWSAWNLLHPKDGKPARLVAVLPDGWKTATRDELGRADGKGNPFDKSYDDTAWKTIRTFTDTRNAQGLPEYFGEIWYRSTYAVPKGSTNLMLHFVKADRRVTLYVNGKQVNAEAKEAFSGGTIDVGGLLRPGEDNQITVRVLHPEAAELYLGGLVGPIYLLEKGGG
jgi:hypothetical protein